MGNAGESFEDPQWRECHATSRILAARSSAFTLNSGSNTGVSPVPDLADSAIANLLASVLQLVASVDEGKTLPLVGNVVAPSKCFAIGLTNPGAH